LPYTKYEPQPGEAFGRLTDVATPDIVHALTLEDLISLRDRPVRELEQPASDEAIRALARRVTRDDVTERKIPKMHLSDAEAAEVRERYAMDRCACSHPRVVHYQPGGSTGGCSDCGCRNYALVVLSSE
jgi:hypothetical protein